MRCLLLLLFISNIVLGQSVTLTLDKQDSNKITLNYVNDKLNNESNSLLWMTLKANKLSNLKRYEEAIILYEDIIKLEPNFHLAYYGIGYSYYKLKKFEEALIYYNKTLLITNYDKALYGMANTYVKLDKYNLAIQYYNKLIYIDSIKYYKVHNNIGVCLIKLKNYYEAINAFDNVLKVNKHNLNAIFNKGIALYLLGNYNQSLFYFKQLIKESPNHSTSHYYLSLIFFKTNKIDEGCEAIYKAINYGYKVNPYELKEYEKRCNNRR